MTSSDDSLKNPDQEIFTANTTEVERLLNDAAAHLQNGRLTEAETLCQEVLRRQPDNPIALNGLGILKHRTGDLEHAVDFLKKAIAAKPDFAEACLNLANIHAELDQFDQAAAGYQQTIKIAPRFADAYYKLGRLLQSRDRLEEAKSHYQQALVLKPDFTEASLYLGETLHLLSQAAANHRGAGVDPETQLRLQLQNAQELCDKAAASQRLGKYDDAMDYYRQAIAVKPDFVKAHGNLGNLLMNQGQLEAALVSYQNVIAVDPDSYIAYNNMGNVLRLQDRLTEAQRSYNRSLQLNKDYVEIHANLGTINLEQGRIDEALEHFRYALRLDPNHIRAAVGESRVYEIRRDFEKAYSSLQPFLKPNHHNVDVALAFAAICRHLRRCDEAIAIMEQLLEGSTPGIGVYERVLLHFQLGQLLDSASEYDRAFAHYSQGNTLKLNQTRHFDPEQHAAFIDDIIHAYDADFMRRAPRAGNASQLPVFIVGMPRSGTSLVEQILATHPDIFGAGELPDITRMAYSLPGMLGTQSPYPQCITGLTPDHCDLLSRRYLERLRQFSSDAERITDKMPGNFLHLGLIALLFPKARVIHCIRNPLDTCLSCYFQNFAEGSAYAYSYDLSYVGSYYRQYQRLMSHWASVLDIPMMNVHYEELIANQEEISRAMIEFCGLAWDEQVLNFHQTKRVVSTASYDQVRRPLYKKSVERWKNYEHNLSRLREALAGH